MVKQYSLFFPSCKKSEPPLTTINIYEFIYCLCFAVIRIPEFFSEETETKIKGKKKERSQKGGHKKQIVDGLNQFYEETFGIKKIYKKPKKKKRSGSSSSSSKDKKFMFLLSIVFTATIYCDSRNCVIKKILKLSSKVKATLMIIAKSIVKDAPITRQLDFTTKSTSDSESESDSDSDSESEDSDSGSDSESESESDTDSDSDSESDKKSKKKTKGKSEDVSKGKKDKSDEIIKKKDDEIKALKRRIAQLEASRDKYKKNYLKAKMISERIFERYKDIGESVIKYEKFQQEKQDKQDKKKLKRKKEAEKSDDEDEDNDDNDDDDDDDNSSSDSDSDSDSKSDDDSDSDSDSDSKSGKRSKKAPSLKYTEINDLESLLD